MGCLACNSVSPTRFHALERGRTRVFGGWYLSVRNCEIFETRDFDRCIRDSVLLYIYYSRVILLGMFNDWLVIYHEAIPLLVYRLILRQPTSITTHGRCVGCDLSIRCKDLENNISLDCLDSLYVVLLVFLSFFFYLMF